MLFFIFEVFKFWINLLCKSIDWFLYEGNTHSGLNFIKRLLLEDLEREYHRKSNLTKLFTIIFKKSACWSHGAVWYIKSILKLVKFCESSLSTLFQQNSKKLYEVMEFYHTKYMLLIHRERVLLYDFEKGSTKRRYACHMVVSRPEFNINTAIVITLQRHVLTYHRRFSIDVNSTATVIINFFRWLTIHDKCCHMNLKLLHHEF